MRAIDPSAASGCPLARSGKYAVRLAGRFEPRATEMSYRLNQLVATGQAGNAAHGAALRTYDNTKRKIIL
jgi:hypothetical protein